MARSAVLSLSQVFETGDSQAARSEALLPAQPGVRPAVSGSARTGFALLPDVARGISDALIGPVPGWGSDGRVIPAKDWITGLDEARLQPVLVTLDTDYYFAALTGSTTTTTTALGVVPASTLVTGSGTNISFFLTWDSTVANASQAFVDTIVAAAKQIADSLSSKYAVTLNLQVGFGSLNNSALPSGALGASSTYIYTYGSGATAYNAFRNKLAACTSNSVIDNALLGYAVPSKTPLLSTAKVYFTGAQGKALGALSGASTSLDGFIGFANTGYFQTDSAGVYDLKAVAIHEITEFMGRIMQQGSGGAYTEMDLMHYSSPGKRTNLKGGYLSADGTNKLGYLNAQSSGDAGDWASPTQVRPNLGNDACNAFASPGANTLSPNDWFTMDALGWNLAAGSGLTTSSTPSYVA